MKMKKSRNQVAEPQLKEAELRGSACINGKTITLAQGLANIAPEHKKDMDELRKQFPIEELLWGGYLQITFPGL